ncbi:MAG TPA: hypothetical protein VJU81_24650 [Methylomirabilota bacterium]|nr:hypothetical protein [Methylomirabilota bacterium]
MTEYLKGNYKVGAKIEEEAEAADATEQFEKKALSRLGGSICFVSKKTLMWNGEPQPQARRADTVEGAERSEAGEPQPRVDKEHGAGPTDR